MLVTVSYRRTACPASLHVVLSIRKIHEIVMEN